MHSGSTPAPTELQLKIAAEQARRVAAAEQAKQRELQLYREIDTSITQLTKAINQCKKKLPSEIEPYISLLVASFSQLTKNLTALNSALYQSYIDIFLRIPLKFSTYTSVALIPVEDFQAYMLLYESHLAELSKIFLTAKQTFIRSQAAATKPFTYLELGKQLNERLNQAPLERFLDWHRGGFSVNGNSYDTYRDRLNLTEASRYHITQFCRVNRLNDRQINFLMYKVHQHRLTGLMTLPMNTFESFVQARHLEYGINWENSLTININGDGYKSVCVDPSDPTSPPENALAIQVEGVLVAKSLFDSSNILPIAKLCLTFCIHAAIPWRIMSSVDPEIGEHFLPESMTAKLEFAIFDKANDPAGLKRLFVESMVCDRNSTVAIVDVSGSWNRLTAESDA